MSKIKLTTYLNKIEAKYIKAREEWVSLQKKLKMENDRFENIKWGNLSLDGKTEERNKHEEIKKDIYKKLEKLRNDFSDSVDSIQDDSDKVFNRLYRFTPEDVDEKGVAIIQTANLKSSELIDLAESYRAKGNPTMYFMVAEKLKVDKPTIKMTEQEKEASAYYTKAQERRNRDDHQLLQNYKEVCMMALRDEDYLSDGIDKIHDDFYQGHKEEADLIEVDSVAPWES